jgi:hypothetical protein
LPTTFVKAVATSGLIFDKTVDDEKGDDEAGPQLVQEGEDITECLSKRRKCGW